MGGCGAGGASTGPHGLGCPKNPPCAGSAAGLGAVVHLMDQVLICTQIVLENPRSLLFTSLCSSPPALAPLGFWEHQTNTSGPRNEQLWDAGVGKLRQRDPHAPKAAPHLPACTAGWRIPPGTGCGAARP